MKKIPCKICGGAGVVYTGKTFSNGTAARCDCKKHPARQFERRFIEKK